MKSAHLDEMVKGWFIGDFEPSILQSKNCEVAVKYYRQGDYEETHHHRVAIEVTVIVAGTVQMLGKKWNAGDIIVVYPGEATDFLALTDATNVVVKLPSVRGDKYPGLS